jgi:mycofactocin system glycosyltransferase
VPHFADDRLALVAPRITGGPSCDGPLLSRYESARSPLDLGLTPARVRAGTRVSYLPGAVLVARTEVVRAVGGFDESMRVGEDVDLVWRIDEAGWRCRYEPAALAHHRPRSHLAAWWRQRQRYGTSAGPLARRHPGALAPVAVSGWSAAVWAFVALGAPLAATAVGLASALALAADLEPLEHPLQEALRLAGLGHLHAGRLLATAVVRAWWPVALTAALAGRRARAVVAVAALAPALVDWWRTRPPLTPAYYVALRLADDAAYGTGLWGGALAARTAGPLLPDLTRLS